MDYIESLVLLALAVGIYLLLRWERQRMMAELCAELIEKLSTRHHNVPEGDPIHVPVGPPARIEGQRIDDHDDDDTLDDVSSLPSFMELEQQGPSVRVTRSSSSSSRARRPPSAASR